MYAYRGAVAERARLDGPPGPSSPRLSIIDDYVVLDEPSAVLDP
jgi:hypothetical protein